MTDRNPDEYNGWPNRETWACALWLQNDERLHNESARVVADVAADCADWYTARPEMGPMPVDAAAHRAGEALRDWLEDLIFETEEACPGTLSTMLSDVGSRWRINWHTIAQALLAD